MPDFNKTFPLLLSILVLLQSPVLRAQSCYEEIMDVSGFDTAPYLDGLNTAACDLIATFPDSTYADSFKVYSFGFYVNMEYFDGYSYPQAFVDVKNEVAAQSPYYLLIGRQSDPSGIYTRFWVDVKLPETGSFECLDENKFDGLISELEMTLNSDIENPYTFAQREKDAIGRMKSFVQRLEICCYANRAGRQFSDIDSSLLNINVCIDNSCEYEENGTEEEGIVAIIGSLPSMPEIGFSLEYFGDTLCSGLNAKLKVYYERGRQDSIVVEIEEIEIGYYYQFDFGDIALISGGLVRPLIQGGRAELIITDQFEEFLKSFKFSIKGQNPTALDVYSLCDVSPDNEIWFLKQLLTHESGSFPQGLNSKLKQFNHFDASQEDLWTSWDAYSRCPNASDNGDGGWGLGQQTNSPIPERQVLWDWRANVHDAYRRLEYDKKVIYRTYITQRLTRISDWEENNPLMPPVSGHTDFNHGGVTWTHSMSPLFSGEPNSWHDHFSTPLEPGNRSFLDAAYMKLYNSQGGDHFYHLDDSGIIFGAPSPVWDIDIDAHYGNNNQHVNYYVRDVVETVIPQN